MPFHLTVNSDDKPTAGIQPTVRRADGGVGCLLPAGTILLIGAFFVKLFILGFFGIGLIFAGSALNLVINTLLSIGRYRKDKTVGFPWALFWQAVLALALTVITLWLLYFFYRHGEMPTFLRPSTDCSIGTDWR